MKIKLDEIIQICRLISDLNFSEAYHISNIFDSLFNDFSSTSYFLNFRILIILIHYSNVFSSFTRWGNSSFDLYKTAVFSLPAVVITNLVPYVTRRFWTLSVAILIFSIPMCFFLFILKKPRKDQKWSSASNLLFCYDNFVFLHFIFAQEDTHFIY